MDGDMRRALRSEGQGLEALVQIGKRGVDPGVLAELDSQLKRNHLVKIRFLRSATGGDRDAEETLISRLVDEVSAELVERRGHTALVYRRRKPKKDGRPKG